jgi:sarcosine oxidase, subunit delta
MFLLTCPFCREKREEEEFNFGGEAFIARPADPASMDDAAWGDYLFMRKNTKGANWEMWGHTAGCRKWFVVKRNTATHVIDGAWTLAEARKIYDSEGGGT